MIRWPTWAGALASNPNGNFSDTLFGVVTSTRIPGREGQIGVKFFW